MTIKKIKINNITSRRVGTNKILNNFRKILKTRKLIMITNSNKISPKDCNKGNTLSNKIQKW